MLLLPMISIIIPSYNYGHLIADTIHSLLRQTYRDIEIIVVNDGSKDNTEAVVQAIAQQDKRVACYSFSNTGLGASRNRGLEVAKGDFIQFLDADDLIEKKKFEVQLKLFAKTRKPMLYMAAFGISQMIPIILRKDC
ncbi:MAG: glycosyltransferase family 2 protein [Bacteroidota bacterium]